VSVISAAIQRAPRPLMRTKKAALRGGLLGIGEDLCRGGRLGAEPPKIDAGEEGLHMRFKMVLFWGGVK